MMNDWIGERRCFVVGGNHETLHPFRQRVLLSSATEKEKKTLRVDLESRLSRQFFVLQDEEKSFGSLNLVGLRWHGFPDQVRKMFDLYIPV